MLPRTPFILWRSILLDFSRTLALTCFSLLAVIAFAGAIRPLAEGQIGLTDALLLTLLLSIPMLQFALPFAAGFAATISYHRFASDNEGVAAAAGGISHRSLLAPAALAGLVLAGMLAIMSNTLIPTFLLRAEQLIHRDITRYMVAPIRKGQPIRIGHYQVYANRVVGPIPTTPESGALEHLALFGVLMLDSADAENLSYYSAERVDLWLFEDPDDLRATAVQLVFTGVSTNSEDDVFEQQQMSLKRIRIPSSVEDDPKYLSLGELREAVREPRRLGPVDVRARLLAATVAQHHLIAEIRHDIEQNGRTTLAREDARIVVTGDRLSFADGVWSILPASATAQITVSMRFRDGFERTHWASSASLVFGDAGRRPGRPAAASADSSALIDLSLIEVVTLDGGADGADVESDMQTYSQLSQPGFDKSRWFDASVEELLAEAESIMLAGSELTPQIRLAAANTRKTSESFAREITSKVHERAAYPVACFVMVLTGAILAFRFRDSLPLPVFLFSFFPALFAFLTISSGQRVTHKQGELGLLLLWGGVAALALFTLFEYRRLRRH